MTLPQVDALAAYWRTVPPPAVQLRRIAHALGLQDAKPVAAPAKSADAAMREAFGAGLPVMHGRPDDPMLDLIGL